VKYILMILALVALTTSVFAAGPAEILVKNDDKNGYGVQVETALAAKWPAANVTVHTAKTWDAFVADLTGGTTWDIVIVEAFYFQGLAESQYNALIDYYDDGNGCLFFSDWSIGEEGLNDGLMNALGITSAVHISTTTPPLYTWVAPHTITEGISDWSWNNPDMGYTHSKFAWEGDTFPVTGWMPSETPAQGGICAVPGVAKNSVVSGYYPSLANGHAEIWDNIFDYMWDGGTGIEAASLGEIKAIYK